MEGAGFNQKPQAPLFGMVGSSDNSHPKYLSIDDIFADCFGESDADLMNLIGNQGSNSTNSRLANLPAGFYGQSNYPGSFDSTELNLRQQDIQHSNRQDVSVVPHIEENKSVSSASISKSSSKSSIKEESRPKRQRNSGMRSMSEQQKLERRERNREHAKRSRVRKKFLLESLQKSVSALQGENDRLRDAIRTNCHDASELLAKAEIGGGVLALNPEDATRVLDDPDYSLVRALQTAQQNFVITDPLLPDNPIVFASQGFLDLTGYAMGQVLGRNCRFLQGPDTDPKAVERIRKAINHGCDTSVLLLNYRADATTFWNQFFIAALRDAEGKIINYVGVQCKVSEEFVVAIQKKGQDGNDEDFQDFDDDDDDAWDA